ncbi:MAG: hypothetical protein G3W58_22795 [Pantoea ananatis]|nr:hypothetical protein [Pantoea ananatis]
MNKVQFAGKTYLSISGFENRASRRNSSHAARNNLEGRRKAHRMNRPERLEEVDRGHQKLADFFKIAP